MYLHFTIVILTINNTLNSILKSYDAYLDPGSGSFILQLLIASLVGAAFIIKTYWRRINGYIRKLFNREEIDEDE